MLTQIPIQINYIYACNENTSLSGEVNVTAFTRLQEVLDITNDEQGIVAYQLTFGIDNNGIFFLQGMLSTTVTLLCQRCLQDMQKVIASRFLFALLRSEKESLAISDEYEAFWVDEESEQKEMLNVFAIIEDELLLSLPFIAKHDKACQPLLEKMDMEVKEQPKENPFAVLAKLKTP